MTLSIPSAPQKRFLANGKSRDTQTTFVFSNSEARLLNVLTDVAHVAVSIVGKMFKIKLAPLKSLKFVVDKSTFFKLKSGAISPTFGSSPFVLNGAPFNVTVAIIVVYLCELQN